MKFKKAFAWILAVAMVITLMPSMAFATSTNSVPRVYTVASDESMPVVAVDMKVNNTDGLERNTPQKIKLTLENAEWDIDDVNVDNVYNNSLLSNSNIGGVLVTTAPAVGSFAPVASNQIEINAVDNDTVTLTYTPSAHVEKDATVRLNLGLSAGSESGPVNVVIDQMDSAFTGGTYTVATVSGNTTITNVTGKVKTYPRQKVDAADVAAVEITETAVTSIDSDQILKLTLPKGYSWLGLQIEGDLIDGNTAIQGNNVTSTTNLTQLESAASGDFIKVDERTMYVKIGIDGNRELRQSIILKPEFDITRDAAMGDVTLTVSGYKAIANTGNDNKVSTASGLIIAVYGDETVEVTTDAEDNLPQVVSGFIEDKDDNLFVAKIILEEKTKGSLSAGRYIDFDFNDEAQIVTDEAIKYYVGSSTSKDYNDGIEFGNNGIGAPLIDRETDTTKDCSEFTLTVPTYGANGADKSKALSGWDPTKPNKLVLFVPITAKANYSGDITCKVSGAKAGVEETELVVAKATPVFSVETEVTKIINGAQNQASANIKITENVSGYVDMNDVITLAIDTAGLDPDSFAFDKANGSVTGGDLEIRDKIRKVSASGGTAKNALAIDIKDVSTQESTIELTDIVINMARNLPEGEYKVNATLDGIENAAYDDKDFGYSVVKTAYVNNATAANNDTTTSSAAINAVFTLRQDTFINNGETVQMDTAPYLDANNRTQLPIRYAAIACGVPESDITWNQASQTATINAGNTVLRITIGSNIMQTSAGPITMDTVAVSSNGRIFVPIRYIANALGADVGWDYDTKTITLTGRQ